MSQGNICPVTRALLTMLPGAQVIARRERSWHSATFGGSRVTLCLQVPMTEDDAALVDFRQILPDHDFALKKGMVADIAIVEEQRTSAMDLSITIEILLLDE
jgi:hypothetical protein